MAGEKVDLVEVVGEQLPFMTHGTGDPFASALTGAVMCGHSVYDAVAFATDFVRDAMRVTRLQPDNEVRGVSFESLLGQVAALVG